MTSSAGIGGFKIGYWNINTLNAQRGENGLREEKISSIMNDKHIDIMLLSETCRSGHGKIWIDNNRKLAFYNGNEQTGIKAKGCVMAILGDNFHRLCKKITVYFPFSKKHINHAPHPENKNQDIEYGVDYKYWKCQYDRDSDDDNSFEKSEELIEFKSEPFHSNVNLNFTTEDENLHMLVLSFETENGIFNLFCCYAPVLDIRDIKISNEVWRFYMEFLEKMLAKFTGQLVAICGYLNADINSECKHTKTSIRSTVLYSKREPINQISGSDHHEARRKKLIEICDKFNLEISSKDFGTVGSIYHIGDCFLEETTVSTYCSLSTSANVDHFVIGYCQEAKDGTMAKVEDEETLVDPEKGTCWLFELTTEKMIDEKFRRLCIANLNFGHNQCTPPVDTSAGTGTSHDQSQVTRQKPPSTVSPNTQSSSSPNLTGVTDAGDTPQGMAKTLESTFDRNPSEQDVEELASGFKKLTTGEEKKRFQRSRFDTV